MTPENLVEMKSNSIQRSKNNRNKSKQYDIDFSQQLESQLKLSKKMNGKTKKNQVSLNHLLHFQSYEELDEYKNSQKRRSKPNRKQPHRKSFDHYPDKYRAPLSGMSFINLNYKFIVDYRGDYRPQQLDPNVPVTPDDIIRIVALKGNACPICLSDEPVAPRMITSCGHILCLKCMISLLDTEIPTNKKKESAAIIEKYNDCPLCGAIIRKKDTKPVLISNHDERFETPKIGDDVIMNLMTRPHNKTFAVPRSIESVHFQITNFPFIEMNDFDLSSYLRIFKGDLKYIINMYQEEKTEILKSLEEDKQLYNEDGKYHMMAIDQINRDIDLWTSKYNEDKPNKFDEIPKQEDINSGNCFFFYQTGFNTRTTFVLSPLDIKVLKTNFDDDYSHLPSSIITKVENIQYEELTPENSMKKYKYLSHLPLGTPIGFIQCNWSKNEYIKEETWAIFNEELNKRSKKSNKKFQKEERDKKRAQTEEERKNKLFFERENQMTSSPLNDYYNQIDNDDYDYYGNGGSLSIRDNRDFTSSFAALSVEDEEAVEDDIAPNSYETTVWGTKIKKSERTGSNEQDEDDWNAEEMIRKAKEEMNRQEAEGSKKGKKKKKKLILLSSNY